MRGVISSFFRIVFLLRKEQGAGRVDLCLCNGSNERQPVLKLYGNLFLDILTSQRLAAAVVWKAYK